MKILADRTVVPGLWWKRAVAATCCAAALLIAPAASAADPPLLVVKRFVVEGENPLSAAATDAILNPHLGPHMSLATLESAAGALQAAIRASGHSFHRVIVPEQRPAEGELRLRILSFVLDRMTVTGNQHFSAESILRSLPGLKPGRAPNVGLLAQQMSLANEHASKRLVLQIKEGVKLDTVDAEVRVADAPASQFFVSLAGGSRDFNNQLNRNTGYTRLTLGYQHSNLFDRDHTGTLAYTTSPERPDRVTQIGAFYTVPFYGYHTQLSAYYTYSDINSGTVGIGAQSFDVSGSGTFYGARLTYLLPRYDNLVHNVSVAWDERYFESTVAFLGAALPVSRVGSRPLTLRYGAKSERAQATVAGFFEFVHNLDGGRANDMLAYAAARPGADPEWNAYRYGLDATYTLGARWSLSGKFRGQHTNKALIPGEQLGIAGTAGVRGFREREITGDKGYFTNVEAHGPQIFAGLAPFAFYDHGARTLVRPVIGSSTREHIASAGLGFKWRWQRIDLSLTWAHVLQGAANGTPTDYDKLNLTGFYRF